jgi:hypothetical protein
MSQGYIHLRPRSLLTVLWAASVLALVPVTTALGATVTNTDDFGAGSLRAAIQSGDGSITFNAGATGTLNLASALPVISHDVQIQGPGAGQLTVRRDSGGNYRIFTVNSGATVGISGLTISNGSATLRLGGGIYNLGTLTISGSVVTGNTAQGGGGIFSGGNLARLTVIRSTVSGNQVSGGSVSGGFGGGILNGGTLKVQRSLVTLNTATGGGGGIHTSNENRLAQTIQNTTVTGNQAFTGGGISSDAYNNSTVSLASSTVASNTSNASFGANIAGRTTTVRNTIIANPHGGTNCQYGVTSQGYNLESANSCGLDKPTDLVAMPPGIDGNLQNNGGPTETMRLLATSPAIDCGDTGSLSSDQRGRPRPVDLSRILNAPGGDGADIGAYEVQSQAFVASGRCASRPPNDFAFDRVIRHRKHGTATLNLRVPGPGKLVLHGKNLRRDTKDAAAAGKARLGVRSRGKARRRLRRTGHARVSAKVRFTPTGGIPNTKAKTVRLIKRR